MSQSGERGLVAGQKREAGATFMFQRSEENHWRFLVPIGVLWSDSATRFATRLSLNSTHPSTKSRLLEPDFFFFLLTWRSAGRTQTGETPPELSTAHMGGVLL